MPDQQFGDLWHELLGPPSEGLAGRRRIAQTGLDFRRAKQRWIHLDVVPLGDDLDQCATLLGAAIQGTDVSPSSSSLGSGMTAVRTGR